MVFICIYELEKKIIFDFIKFNSYDLHKLLRVLLSLYVLCIKNSELSDEINIKRVVRQGCILSPLLFNLFHRKYLRII